MLLLIFLIFTQISASLRITKTQAASLLTGLNIFSYPNATECFEAVYSATTNQSYGQLISDSLSRMVEECPQASLNYLDDLDAHFKSFENSTAEQVMESFLFGLLSATPDHAPAAFGGARGQLQQWLPCTKQCVVLLGNRIPSSNPAERRRRRSRRSV